MTTIASISNRPADVIAALHRGAPTPHKRIRKLTVRRAIAAAIRRGRNYVILRGRKIVW